jgi:tetratricopeptide (TPR) repeat protein
VETLDDTDRWHLRAAEGWLGLGSWRDAQQELEAIPAAKRRQPETLEVQWEITAAAKDWNAALEIAAITIQLAPDDVAGWIHRSYSLHELKRTPEARDNLLRVVDKFPDNPTLRYNLACYECQLGRLDQAWTWLRKALRLGNVGGLLKMALEDIDLVPLHSRCQRLLAGLNPESGPHPD